MGSYFTRGTWKALMTWTGSACCRAAPRSTPSSSAAAAASSVLTCAAPHCQPQHKPGCNSALKDVNPCALQTAVLGTVLV